jgi:phenylpropionate dioxygenase-like ring-hydroxylating dioxygenase large terminal subunit
MKDDIFNIGRFGIDPKDAWTMPAPYFYDPNIYSVEMREIFRKTWRFVGHESQVSRRGDFVTRDIGDESVIVLRGRDGVLRAFYNVCQHRAHRLLKERQGSIQSVIVCPYHAWTYESTGKLRGAKNAENVCGFDKQSFGLKSVALEIFCGFVFINLSSNPGPLAGQVPGFEETLRRHIPDLDRMQFNGQQDFDIDANWKVVVENSLDAYHVYLSGPAHRAFGNLIDQADIEMTPKGGWMLLRSGPGDPDNQAYNFRSNIGKGQTKDYVTLFLWPDLLLFTYPYVNGLWSFLVSPRSPERTHEEIAVYTPNGAILDESTRAAVDWIKNSLGPEDVQLNFGVQAGLKSAGYHQSRLLVQDALGWSSEHSIHYFQALVLESLGQIEAGSASKLVDAYRVRNAG